MKKYTIPVEWVMVTDVIVEANSLKEAIERVENMPGLPSDGEYLGDSFKVNKSMIGEINEEDLIVK
ncbi:MAG: hypothetical protein AABY22_07040 [Nanoarchaeota archaeon]